MTSDGDDADARRFEALVIEFTVSRVDPGLADTPALAAVVKTTTTAPAPKT